MRKHLAIWAPINVQLFCSTCFVELLKLKIGEVKHLGQASIKCKNCRSVNTIPPDLLRHTRSVEAKVDPDNPPGRAAAWESIVGNPNLRRAIEVALVGYHTLTYVGHPGNGWEQVKDILGDRASIMQRCPCGLVFPTHQPADNWTEVEVSDGPVCGCTYSEILAHRRTKNYKLAVASDILAEAYTPTLEESFADGEPYLNAYMRIQKVRESQVWVRARMDLRETEAPFQLLNWARKRYTFDKDTLVRTQRVACTIAEMDGEDVVNGSHMSEAVSYRVALDF